MSGEKFSQKLAEFVLKTKVPIIIVILIFTVFFGYYATKIRIDADILNSLPDSDKFAKFYKSVGEKYEGNLATMIILETDNVLTPQVLEDVKAVTDSLQNIDGIVSVSSLTNIIDIKSSDFGIEIGKLVDEYDLPKTRQELDSLAQVIFSDPMYKGVIVSEDTTATMIVATLSADADKERVAKEIKQKVNALNLSEKVYFTGIPVMLSDTNTLILNDLYKLIPITSVIIIVILFLGFRSGQGVILPLTVVLLSNIWTVGLMALTNTEFTIISDIIPVILLALGSAYTIHVLNRINLERTVSDKAKYLVKALAVILVPVFLAYITTAFGFLSFIFGSYLTAIKQFGIFTAIGITFAFIFSITFVPAVSDFFKNGKNIKPAEKQGFTFLKRIAQSVIDHPKFVLLAWLGLVLILFAGIFRIERKVDMISYYKKGSPIRVSQELVDKKFGGVSPVFVVMKGDVQSPDFLKLMSRIEDTLKTNPYVSYTMSVADLIEQMNEAMGEGKKIPGERAKIEQLWFLIEGEDILEQLVSPDLDEAVIQARFASLDTKESTDFANFLDSLVAKYSSDKIQVSVTGMPHIYRQLDRSLLKSQFTSLLLAIALMFLIVAITLNSAKDGLMAILPLLLTILLNFGFMGLVGIPLDVVTVLVGSVTMGVGIDYAIHVISHFRAFKRQGFDAREAILKTINDSGKAILINVLSVAAGFLTLLFANLQPLKNFGLMMAFTMIIAGFSAITFLTALLFIWEKKQKNEA